MRKVKVYKGYWNFHSDTPSVAGTLNVGIDITLDLTDLNKKYYKQDTVDCLRGVAIDDDNETYSFYLYGLTKVSSLWSSQGIQTYQFSVSYLVFSPQPFLHECNGNVLKTNQIVINCPYLNWWCRALVKEQKYDVDQNKITYNYTYQEPILISKLDNCDIYAFIASKWGTPQHEGFHNKLESHIKIVFGDSLELKLTFLLVQKIERLLSLFMSTPVVSDSISFSSDEIDFTCIHNITARHYHYRQKSDDEAVFTSRINDVADNQVIRHWCDFYDGEQHALSLFFDTIYNEELSDELMIVCYSSVLEELTKRYYVQGQPKRETKVRKRLLEIIDSLRKSGNKDGANYLKTKFLDKDDTFESRLLALLKKHQDVWEMLDVEDFASRAVITRIFLYIAKLMKIWNDFYMHQKNMKNLPALLDTLFRRRC